MMAGRTVVTAPLAALLAIIAMGLAAVQAAGQGSAASAQATAAASAAGQAQATAVGPATTTATASAVVGLPAIRTVELGRQREFLVNGQPFFPIMAWMQDSENLPKLKAIGFNTVAGYWWEDLSNRGAGDTANAAEYAEQVRQAGLYFIAAFKSQQPEVMKQLTASPALLAWIHEGQPDKPTSVSDAVIVPAADLRLRRLAPLFGLVDGDRFSWSVLDPLEGAEFTIRQKKFVTVEAIAVYLTINPGLAVAREIIFTGDEKVILRAFLENKKGEQKFPLTTPATFRELRVRVTSAYAGKNAWGSIGEIEAFDKAGRNVLVTVLRKVPESTPEQALAHYQAVKSFDPARPVLMTVTGFFMSDKSFDNWWKKDEKGKLYPALLKAADAVGFDIYPLYGWNRPEKIAWVGQGLAELRDYAGRDKPVYEWIECLPGAKFGEQAAAVTGLEIRSEVWQALINGATAIGYFTQSFEPGEVIEFNVPAENQAVMAEINAQIQRLAPVILSGNASRQPKIEIAGNLPAAALAKEYQGRIYLFAQNLDAGKRSGAGTIRLDGLKSGTTVEVVDEHRTITAEDGRFSDDFEPLAVHIYKVGS